MFYAKILRRSEPLLGFEHGSMEIRRGIVEHNLRFGPKCRANEQRCTSLLKSVPEGIARLVCILLKEIPGLLVVVTAISCFPK